jgi:hypothetical protein
MFLPKRSYYCCTICGRASKNVHGSDYRFAGLPRIQQKTLP